MQRQHQQRYPLHHAGVFPQQLVKVNKKGMDHDWSFLMDSYECRAQVRTPAVAARWSEGARECGVVVVGVEEFCRGHPHHHDVMNCPG